MLRARPDRLPCGCPAIPDGNWQAGNFRIRYSRYLPSCSSGWHAHDESRLVLSADAGFVSHYRNVGFDIAPSSALYRPAGDLHCDRYTHPIAYLSLLLPAAAPEFGKARLFQDAALAGAALAMARETLARDAASALIVEGLALHLCSALLVRHGPSAERAPRWLAHVRERLDQDGPVPSLRVLAEIANREPAHVTASFSRRYGLAPGVYVRRLRLWRARHHLDAAPESSLAEIAQQFGFADQSHFTRHFRRAFGLTPAAWRRRYGRLR